MENAARPVRVGYLLRMYPRFSQTFIVNEILELERRGLDIRVASLRKPSEGRFHELVCRVRAEADYLPETLCGRMTKTCRVHGSLIWRQPSPYLRAFAGVVRFSGARLMDLVQAGYLVRWARKKRVDHLHVHFGTGEATVAWLARILGGPPYSMALHAVDIFQNDVDRRLLGEKINGSTFTIVNTEFNRRFVMEHIPCVEAEKLRLSYNGVDLDRFKPSHRRRRRGTVLAIGRLVEKKGFIHLIRALARLRDRGLGFKCKIAGEGPLKARLKGEVARLGLESSVVLTGPLQHDTVRELMERYSCFVLPCVRTADGNMDGVPNVLLEALSTGCPAVSTNLSGIPELIENEVTGLTAPPGDEDALADAVHRVLTDSDLAGRLAAAGRRRVEERFSMERNLATVHGWLVEAAVGARRASIAAPSRKVGGSEFLLAPGGRA